MLACCCWPVGLSVVSKRKLCTIDAPKKQYRKRKNLEAVGILIETPMGKWDTVGARSWSREYSERTDSESMGINKLQWKRRELLHTTVLPVRIFRTTKSWSYFWSGGAIGTSLRVHFFFYNIQKSHTNNNIDILYSIDSISEWGEHTQDLQSTPFLLGTGLERNRDQMLTAIPRIRSFME